MEQEKFVDLNDDQKEVLKRRGKDLFFALSQLLEWGEKGQLTEEMKETLPNLIQSHLSDIKKTVGFTGEESERLKEMTKSITTHMQERIKELEDMVNNPNSLLPVKQQLEYIHKKIDKWWKKYGFEYISEFQFTGNGNVKLQFGFMLDNLMLKYSDTPDSDAKAVKNKIQNFKDQGYIFVNDKHERDKNLIFCDSNMELLTNLILSAFPTAAIIEWKNHMVMSGPDKGKPYIRHIEVMIYDYAELEKLPSGEN